MQPVSSLGNIKGQAPHDLNVMIVDDEKVACRNLRNILIDYVDPGINIVGYAHNTIEAEQKIAQYTPDALFLDIELPRENAFDFLERLSPIDFEVVFVTAYEEYAIKAFKLNAVDYILKPISIHDLSEAVAKLKHRIFYKDLGKNISYKELSHQISTRSVAQRLTLKSGQNVEVVDFDDISYIEAKGSYSRVVFWKGKEIKEVIMSYSLSEYEELLPLGIFYRIHKSFLVNHHRITSVLKDESYFAEVDNRMKLPISRRKYNDLMSFLKRK